MPAPRAHPDRVLRPLSEIPPYLQNRYGNTVTRMTVYNWVRHGRKGHRLRTVSKSAVDPTLLTTYEWVREFLAKTSTRRNA